MKKSDAILISSVPNIIYLTGFSAFSEIEREAFVLLTKNKKYIYAYIYREKYNLQVYSTILMREGCVKNLSKIKYHLVRGKLDLNALQRRKTSRSKYEAKNLRKYL